MDSSAHTAPFVSQGIMKNWVAALLEISPEIAFTGDEWIRQPKQPLLTHKQSRKTVNT
jgi:hypothetical protein